MKRKNQRTREFPAPPKPGISFWEYLRTPYWIARRERKRKNRHRKCERCGEKAWKVFHKHHDSLGHEKDSDLELVCDYCMGKQFHSLKQADRHLASIVLFTIL